MSGERCEHGVSFEDFCEPCAHHPIQEWVGYPMTACAWELVPWPCAFERARRASGATGTDHEGVSGD